MGKFFKIIASLLIVLIAVLLYFQNTVSVSINLLFFNKTLSLGLLIMLAFLLGMVLGGILLLPLITKLVWKNSRLHTKQQKTLTQKNGNESNKVLKDGLL